MEPLPGERLAHVLLATTRWGGYGAAFLIMGAGAFRFWVLRALRRTSEQDFGISEAMGRAAARLGLAGAIALVVFVAARLYAQTYSIFGLDEPVTFELIRTTGFESRWGTGWRWQAGSAVFALVTLAAAGRRSAWGWYAAAVGASLVGISLTLTGHAPAYHAPVSVLLQSVHVIAAGAWLGTLVVVLRVGMRRYGKPDADERAKRAEMLARLVTAFSPLALAAAGAVVLTGTITAFLYLSAISDLWATAYGRVLVLKVVLFAVVATVGAYNWRRVSPQLGTPAGSAALSRSAAGELAVAVVVLLVTGFLVGMPLPGE